MVSPKPVPHEVIADITKLMFCDKGPMSFHSRGIPRDIAIDIAKAATSCSWLGKWKAIFVVGKENRARVVSAWQQGLRQRGEHRSAEFVERWNAAPLFVVFCQPKQIEQFQWVPGEFARIFSIGEVGGAVRSLELVATSYGIGLHGIMGVLVPDIGEPIKHILRIPEDQEIIYFGVMGQPDEVVSVKYRSPSEICYKETWGNPLSVRF